jgi:hypothetical protein
MGMGDQRHAPAALPTGKTRYPLYRRLGGPQGRSTGKTRYPLYRRLGGPQGRSTGKTRYPLYRRLGGPQGRSTGKTRYPLYRRLGGPQGRSGRVRKKIASNGFRSRDRPAHSVSLYRLSLPGPRVKYIRSVIKLTRVCVTF